MATHSRVFSLLLTALLVFTNFKYISNAEFSSADVAKADSLGLISGQTEEPLLFPKYRSVPEMPWYVIADLLKLRFSPNTGLSADQSPQTLIQLIARNFFFSLTTEFSADDLAAARRAGYRHPRYNREVLVQVMRDIRIQDFLGYSGCLEIAKMLVESIGNKLKCRPCDTVRVKLKYAVGCVEDFISFTLYSMTTPYQYERGQLQYIEEEECLIELTYYEAAKNALPINLVLDVKSSKTLTTVIERFFPWLPESELTKLFVQIRQFSERLDVHTMRAIITPFVKLTGQPVINMKLMQRLYPQASTISDTEDSMLYCAMAPILRALTAQDSICLIKTYLRAFHVIFSPPKNNPHILKILNYMLADTKFNVFKPTESTHRRVIFRSVLNALRINATDALLMAIGKEQLNLVEAFLLHFQLDTDSQTMCLKTAIKSIKFTDSIEILAMIVAHSPSMNAERLRELARAIDLRVAFAAVQNWFLQSSYDTYNRKAVAKHFFLQVAAILDMFEWPVKRSIEAAFEGEEIVLPCPILLFDFLLPELYGIDRTPAIANQYPIFYPLHMMQVLLFRTFGIPLAAMRIFEDNRDVPDWREVIGYGNFMLTRYKSLLGLDEAVEVVRFADPLYHELKRTASSDDELCRMYREASSSRSSTPRTIAPRAYSDEETTTDEGYLLL